MHTPNHLLSPEMAIIGGVVAATLIGVAISKVRREPLREKLPLAGTLGAFVFAVQMLNIAIGNVGCSGHLIGGVLLAAMLGKWLGFLTLTGVLAIQALLFADGGIMALGWNVVNMAAIGCLVVYPLIFAPIAKRGTSLSRLFGAGVLSSLVAVELGALGVVLENSLSGASALPVGEFMGFMLPIHLIIGAAEGIVTGGILALMGSRQPAMLNCYKQRGKALATNPRGVIVGFALSALIIGGGFSMFSSSHPDGLEWSIERTLKGTPLAATHKAHTTITQLQEDMAVAPDYQGDYTGLVATASILLLAWVSSGRKKEENK